MESHLMDQPGQENNRQHRAHDGTHDAVVVNIERAGPETRSDTA